MILLLSANFILFSGEIYAQENQLERSFFLTLRDNREIVLNLVFDNNHIPLKYSSEIFTQVCETGECKPVRIILFWDLLGNYIHYELPKGAILTKLDHVPFSEQDYDKFGNILLNNHSVLDDFAINDLTTSKEKASVQEIDGITGATPKSISNAIVEGAVYTCYTIWHLAHGEINDRISFITDSICTTPRILNNLIHHHDPDLRRWAIEKVLNQPEFYIEQVQGMIRNINPKDVFEIQFFLKKIPASLLMTEWVQESLWHKYDDFSYAQQTLLLKRFANVKIDSKLEQHIRGLSKQANEAHRSLFDQLKFNL